MLPTLIAYKFRNREFDYGMSDLYEDEATKFLFFDVQRIQKGRLSEH